MKKIFFTCLSFIFKIISFALMALSILIAIISIFKKQWIIDAIEWLKLVINDLGSWNYIIAFISSTIESFPVLGIVVPGQNILLIVGGFFGNMSYINLGYIIAIASIGAMLGNYIGYKLGQIYGDSFFKKYGVWFGIGLTEVRYLEKGIHKWGAWGIIIGKFHPITRAFLPFIAGSMGMKNTKFALYNIIGSIIRSLVIIILGVVFVEYYEPIIEHAGKIMFLFLIGIGIYIYKYKKPQFLEYMREKNKEVEQMTNK